jgi:PGF-pre-PGF domain-containing protein
LKNKIAIYIFLVACIILQATPAMAEGTVVSGTIPLVVSGITVSPISTNSATISWDTNGNSTSEVFYDAATHANTTDYFYHYEALDLVSHHVVNLTLLTSGTTYHYRVLSTIPAEIPADGLEAVTVDSTFTTLTPYIPPPSDGGGGGGGGGPAPGPTVTPVIIPANFASLPPEEAAVIIEKMTPTAAAILLEGLNTDTVIAFLGKTSTAKAADILEKISPEKSIAIMEGLPTDTLTVIILDMSEASLIERLPGLSVEKLHSISPQVLFTALPNVPNEQLVGEIPPEPPAGATAPFTVYSTPDGARYLTIQTWAGEWVMVVGTPAPLDKVMIKTGSSYRNINTVVDILTVGPLEVTARLPETVAAVKYFQIAFENITSKDIQLGYITFKVEKEWIEQYTLNKWGVFLERYDPEITRWVVLPTKIVKEDERYVYYSAVTSHFSLFDITGSQTVTTPIFKAANLVVSPAEAKPGETVTISADITNPSNTNGTYATTLWINGTVESGRDVTLSAGETRRISFMVKRTGEGKFEVRLERLFGQFLIHASTLTQTPVTSPVPTPTRTPASPRPSATPVTPTPKPGIPVSTTPTRWPLIIGIIGGCIVIVSIILLILTRRKKGMS